MFGLRKIAPLTAILIVSMIGLLNGSFSASGQNSVQEGMAVTAYYSGIYQNAETDRTVENIAATGTEWLTILVTQYQSTTSSTSIYPTIKTPTDADLVHIINKARSLGMKVVLKPHVDIENPNSEWRGRIGQNFNDSQWSAWFSTYRNFINHYADFAADNNVEQLVIGTELVIASQRESEWRTVVSQIRDRYNGKLTYSANHSGEEETIAWWDAVDYIGISGYYNLTSETDPTVAEIKAAWAPHLATLSDLSQQWNRPIVFTEIGYRSSDGNNTHPWCHYCNDEALDLQEQADTYQAFFESVYSQPWFAGVHWWAWGLRASDNGICNDGYSPHLKPAENIIRQYFGGGQITLPTTCDGTAPTATPGAPATATTVPPTAVPPTATAPQATPTAAPSTPTTAPPTAVPPTSVPGQCGGLRQEAEAATIGANGAFTIGTDSAASGGQYIEAGQSSANGSYTPSANATFCVTVPTSGTYGLRSRAQAQNTASDSLYFYVDGAPVNGNIWYVWATGSYIITDLYTAQPGTSAQSKFEIQLAAGEHEIAFAGREQGPRLDWIELVLIDAGGTAPTPVPPATATAAPPTPVPPAQPTPTPLPEPQAGCSPMQQEAEQGELVGLFAVGSENAASGGEYVSVPNGQGNRGSAPDDAQKVILCVTVDTPGTYGLRAWTQSPSGFDNSFYVRVDGQPANGILWHTQIGSGYTSEYVVGYNAATGNFQQMTFSLAAGDHQVEFLLREDGIRLDKIAFETVVSAASIGEHTFRDDARLQNDISIVGAQTMNKIYMPLVE